MRIQMSSFEWLPDKVERTVYWQSIMTWRAGPISIELHHYFWNLQIFLKKPAAARMRNRIEVLLDSKSGPHIEEIQKNWGQQISRYCPFQACSMSFRFRNVPGATLATSPLFLLANQEESLTTTGWHPVWSIYSTLATPKRRLVPLLEHIRVGIKLPLCAFENQSILVYLRI
jgi:hypothetical protein